MDPKLKVNYLHVSAEQLGVAALDDDPTWEPLMSVIRYTGAGEARVDEAEPEAERTEDESEEGEEEEEED